MATRHTNVEVVRYPALDALDCPWPEFERLREAGPVHRVEDHPHYLVVRHADVRAILGTPAAFTSLHCQRQMRGLDHFGDEPTVASIIEVDPPQHRQHRSLCQKSFSPGRLRAVKPKVREIADELIDAFIDRGSCDFTREFARELPALVICHIMGIPREDKGLLQDWGDFDMALPYFPPEFVEHQRQRGQVVGDYLATLIAKKHQDPQDDALSHLIQDQIDRDGQFDEEYVRAEAAVLVAGGLITTTHALANAMVLLLENPEQMAKVRSDPTKIPAMFEESIRMRSPVEWVGRLAKDHPTNDLEGTSLPEGAYTMLVLGSANRDETVFDNPDAFDVDRANVKDHLAFGYGPHFCLGAPLARIEVATAFEQILSRMDNIQLADGSDLSRVVSPEFQAPTRICLTFEAAGRA